MNFRFTIGRKILLGFGALIFFVLIAFSLTLYTIRQGREINDKIANLNEPSINALQEMKLLITNSETLIDNWISTSGSSEDKPKLKILISDGYQAKKDSIQKYYGAWSDSAHKLADSIFYYCNELWLMHRSVMEQLSDVSSYNDPSILFPIQDMITGKDGEIKQHTALINNRLDKLIMMQYQAAQSDRAKMLASFKTLSLVVK